MATATAKKIGASTSTDQAASSAIPHDSTCIRCGGLMVSDFFMDLLNSTGELEFAAKRCVQCGEVLDAVIERNRLLRYQASALRKERVGRRLSSI